MTENGFDKTPKVVIYTSQPRSYDMYFSDRKPTKPAAENRDKYLTLLDPVSWGIGTYEPIKLSPKPTEPKPAEVNVDKKEEPKIEQEVVVGRERQRQIDFALRYIQKPSFTKIPKASSCDMYQKIAKSVLKDYDKYRVAFPSQLSSNTIKVRKAALNHSYAETLRNLVVKAELEDMDLNKLIADKLESDKDFATISRILERKSAERTDGITFTPQILVDRNPVYQKNRDYELHNALDTLAKLDGNWTKKVIEQARGQDHREILGVLIATGCRPNEIEKGVEITRNDRGNLVFKVAISKSEHKQDKTHGYIEVNPKHPTMIAFDKLAVGETMEVIAKKDKIQSIVRRIKIEGEIDINVKLFRHQKRVDMLKQRKSTHQIKLCLGHASRKSQQAYGSREFAGTGLRVIKCS